MRTVTRFAPAERAALADLLATVGPDAPTLCAGWTTRDLAAHLIVRGSRVDAAGGIFIKPLAGRTQRVQASVAARPWATLLAQVRRRPPLQAEVAVETVIPPTEIDPGEPVVRAALEAARGVLGHTPALAVSGPANESYLLNAFGIPTCIIGPEGGNAHAADEYVEVESLARMSEVYARVAEALA